MPIIKLDNYLINYQVFFKKNKHLYVRIKDGHILVTSPHRYQIKQIESFLFKHKSWIVKHLNQEKKDLYPDKKMLVWGQWFPVLEVEKLGKKVMIDGQEIHKGPLVCKQDIEAFYKDLTLNKIMMILDEEQHVLSQYIRLDQIKLKSQLMRSRLGSCIHDRRIIKINSLLARFEDKYLKLVLYHELTHLLVQNHSKEFHEKLERIYPNHRLVQKELNQYVKQYKL